MVVTEDNPKKCNKNFTSSIQQILQFKYIIKVIDYYINFIWRACSQRLRMCAKTDGVEKSWVKNF